MDRIQIISIFASLLIFIGVLNLVRRKKLKTEYSLIWLAVSLVFVIFSLWREGIDKISAIVGIAYAPSVLFIILLIGIILLLIEFSIIISKQAERIKVLVQEVALLKHDIEKNRAADEQKKSENISNSEKSEKSFIEKEK